MSLADRTAPVADPWHCRRAIVRDVTTEIPDVATYHLAVQENRGPPKYACLPGQFNMLYLPGVGEVAISVSGRRREDDTWSHTVRTVGGVTRTLARLGPGATIGLRGPYGTPWPMDEIVGHDVVVAAGGIGLAPLRPAVEELIARRNEFGRLSLLYGARTPDTLLYAGEFDRWRRHGFHLETTVDRATADWLGHVGVVPLLLDRLRPLDPARTVVLTCGPEVMMRYVVRSALQRGLLPARIWLSMERNMQCAVGLCGHCQWGPTFVCRDGPVFRYDAVERLLRVEAL